MYFQYRGVTFAYAAPHSALDTRQFQVSVTFSGADGAQYTQNFPRRQQRSQNQYVILRLLPLLLKTQPNMSYQSNRDTLDKLAITFKKRN